MNKSIISLILLLFFDNCLGSNNYFKNDKNTETTEGLYEIQEAANNFIDIENKKNNTKFIVQTVNAKYLVARCIKPLNTKWAPKNKGLSGKNLLVMCNQTVSREPKMEAWEIPVSVK